MSKTAVIVNYTLFCVCDTQDEASQAIEGIRKHNRWWREGKDSVMTKTVPSHVPTTDPINRRWVCTWVPGRAGWDSTPMPIEWGSPFQESVVKNGEGGQVVHVCAPTAYMAELRSKFLLMERGKANE